MWKVPVLTGADPDELERIATQLRVAADELEAEASSLTSTLRSVAWVGGVATRFSSRWDRTHRPRLHSTADAVRDAAARLVRDAAEQRKASRVGPPTTGGPATTGSPEAGDRSPVVRLEAYLDDLGLGRGVVGALVEGAERLVDLGHVDALLEILTGDVVGGVLDGLDVVVDHRDVIVDLVGDFVDHPFLAFDERIVHAIADAATRFGLDQGMELAAEWAGAAVTAMVFPGVGSLLAPIVGALAGEVVGGLMDVAVDAIDGATDVVDRLADGVVDAYRAAKHDVGELLDVAGAATRVVGDAAELLVDAGGVLADLGGDVVGDVTGWLSGAFGD